MSSAKPTTVLVAGVGGQGTILAADVIARCAIAEGYDVKISEIHGMSQRGGAVTTTVRFGEKVHSMIADEGNVDVLVALETTEALRNMKYVASDGIMVVSDYTMETGTVLLGTDTMPPRAKEELESQGALVIDAERIAQECGSAKASNIVLLGALSHGLPFKKDTWLSVISKRVPVKLLEVNLQAFEAGYAFNPLETR